MSNALQEHLASMPVIAILRGVTPDSVIDIAQAIIEAGITVIEVPLNSPDALQSIGLLDKHLHSKGIFGCGTCVDLDSATAVASAGAKIMVTPNTNPEIIAHAITLGMTPIPGWATVSEAFAAYHAGARHLKLFPASTYGEDHIKAARAVLPPDAQILAVGGVGASNAAAWFAAGVSGLGIGSDIYKAGFSADEVSSRASSIASAIGEISVDG
ncbi:MAG: 2-dehydro-3-deoxy-6-phosphogalactonate aldolase [Arenicella sp.]|jgi:2-dehydro-3-deoxyphosphogalactonate aldolase|nr:2-dehydro-3-deoxy-6-phosphogalactonate aldolase [Arenicella sp.]